MQYLGVQGIQSYHLLVTTNRVPVTGTYTVAGQTTKRSASPPERRQKLVTKSIFWRRTRNTTIERNWIELILLRDQHTC